MIAAAALAAGLVATAPARHTAPMLAEPRAWSLRVTGWLRQGAQLCLQASGPAALAALGPRYGARPAPAPRVRSARFSTTFQVLGPRGEVTVSGWGAPGGFRCTVEAASGEAGALQRELPGLVAGLGFVRMPTVPARWPGEAAWRGRGATTGVELFTAAPLVHGAPYGALLQFARSPR